MVLREEIRTILSLQETENEMAKVEAVIRRYEEARPICQTRLARARQKVEESKTALRTLEKQIRETERQVTEWRENLRKFTAQQFKVKNQKEYDALTAQIEETQQKISDADEKGLAYLEQEETLARKLTQLEEHLASEERDCRTELQRIDLGVSENSALLEKLRGGRAVLAAQVDPVFLQRYERMRERFPGDCVVALRDGNCSGCHMRVVLHTIQTSSQGGGLTVCNSCHRLLYVPDV
jgi:predicted  nucleic acid-binding Zn-ribbon protein